MYAQRDRPDEKKAEEAAKEQLEKEKPGEKKVAEEPPRKTCILLISSYMCFPIAYRTQTLGVPKSLKDPHITRVLGTPGPHIPSDMPPVPISLGYGDRGPQIGGSPFHADTGSALKIVHRRLWERGQGDSRKQQQVSGGPVVVANGEPLHILGQTQSKIHLAGIEFTHIVLVTGDVSQDCLLGAGFLTSHGFVIDLQSQVLHHGQRQHHCCCSAASVRQHCLFARCLLGTL